MGFCALEHKIYSSRDPSDPNPDPNPNPNPYTPTHNYHADDRIAITAVVHHAPDAVSASARRSPHARIAARLAHRIIPASDSPTAQDLPSYFNSIIETIKHQLITTDKADFEEVSAPAAAVMAAAMANVQRLYRTCLERHVHAFQKLTTPLWLHFAENGCQLFASFLRWMSAVVVDDGDGSNKFGSNSAYCVLNAMFDAQKEKVTAADPDMVPSVLRVLEQCVEEKEMEWVVDAFVRVFWDKEFFGSLVKSGHYEQILGVTVVAGKTAGLSVVLEMFDIRLKGKGYVNSAKEIVGKAVEGGGLEELAVEMDPLFSPPIFVFV